MSSSSTGRRLSASQVLSRRGNKHLLEEERARNNDLRTQLETVNQELSTAKHEIDAGIDRLKEFQNQIGKEKSKYDEVSKVLEEKERLQMKHEREISDLEAKINENQKLINDLSEKVIEKDRTAHSQDLVIEQLQKDFSEQKKMYGVLEKSAIKDVNASVKREIALQIEVKNLNNQKQHLEKTLNTKISEKDEIISKYEGELKNKGDNLANLNVKFSECYKDKIEIENKLKTMSHEKDSIIESLGTDILRKEQDHMQELLTQKAELLKSFSDEKEKLIAAEEKVRRSLDHEINKVNEMKKEIKELHRTYTEREKDFEEGLSTEKQKSSTLREKYEAANQEKIEKVEKLNTLQALMEKKEDIIRKANQNVKNLQLQLDQESLSRTHAEEKLESFSERLAKEKEESRKQSKEFNSKLKEQKDKYKNLEESKNKAAKAANEIEHILQGELELEKKVSEGFKLELQSALNSSAKLSRELEILQIEVKDEKQKSENMQKDIASKEKILLKTQENIKELQKEINNGNEQIHTYRKKHDESLVEISKLNDRITNYDRKMVTVENREMADQKAVNEKHLLIKDLEMKQSIAENELSKLQKELVIKNEKIISLKDALQEELSKKKSDISGISSLQDTLSSTKSSLLERERKISILENTMKDKDAMCVAWKQEVTSLEKALEDQRVLVSSYENSAEKLERIISEKTSSLQSIEQEHEKLKEGLKEIGKENEDLKNAFVSLQEDRDEKQNGLRKMQEEADFLKKQLTEEIEKGDAMKDAISCLEDSKALIVAKNEETKNKLSDANETISKSKKELIASLNELEEIKKSTEELHHSRNQLIDTNGRLKKDLQSNVEEAKGKERQLKEKEKDILKTRKELEQEKSKQKEMRIAEEQRKRTIEAQKRELKALQKKMTAEQSDIHALQSTIDEYKTILSERDKLVDNLETKALLKENESSVLRKELSENDASLAASEAEIQSLKTIIRTMETENTDLRGKISNTSEGRSSLKKDLADVEKKLKTESKRTKELELAIKKWKVDEGKLRKELEVLKFKAKSDREKFAKELNISEGSREETGQILLNKQQELKELFKKFENQKVFIDLMKKKLKSEQCAIEERELEFEELREEINRDKTIILNLQKDVLNVEEEKIILKTDNERLENKISKIQADMNSLNSTAQCLRATRGEFEVQIVSLQKSLSWEKGHVVSLKKLVEEYKNGERSMAREKLNLDAMLKEKEVLVKNVLLELEEKKKERFGLEKRIEALATELKFKQNNIESLQQIINGYVDSEKKDEDEMENPRSECGESIFALSQIGHSRNNSPEGRVLSVPGCNQSLQSSSNENKGAQHNEEEKRNGDLENGLLHTENDLHDMTLELERVQREKGCIEDLTKALEEKVIVLQSKVQEHYKNEMEWREEYQKMKKIVDDSKLQGDIRWVMTMSRKRKYIFVGATIGLTLISIGLTGAAKKVALFRPLES